jgi:hypothetical protein
VVLLGDALLVVVVGDALDALGDALLVVGDIVVLPSWATAGVLGCITCSYHLRAIEPAASTNTTTISVNVLLSILSTFYATWQYSRCLMVFSFQTCGD